MLKKIIVILVVCFTAQSFAQNRLNDYKYIIVPLEYDFLKEPDKYQLNSLTEFLFNKYGFSAFLKNKDLPLDYSNNNCLALQANVIENKSMFKTKLLVELKNCSGDVVYTSAEGESRRKDYRLSYNEALRNAFKSFKTINYEYVEKIAKADSKSINVEVEQLKKEIKELKEEKTIVKNDIKLETKEDVNLKPSANTLYAQSINNGFQLVDKSPKLIYTIYYSGKNDVFIVKGHDAIIYKLKNNWVIAQFINDNLEVKALDIKF